MATLNLGRIKPVFRGAYNSATAYVVDDIVTSGGETFICILASTGNATSNATYWTKLAQKGTDGTDVGATLTTQGDILYRDGSGLQRLGAGTSGNVLTTKGTGQNPVWEPAVGGKVLQVVQSDNNSYSQGVTSQTLTDIESSSGVTWETAITPSATSSKLLIMPVLMLQVVRHANADARQKYSMEAKIGSGSYSQIFYQYEFGGYDYGNSGIILNQIENPIQLYSPNTTSEVKIKFKIAVGDAGSINTSWGGSPSAIQRCIIMEIGA
jgi:hypothetical protein